MAIRQSRSRQQASSPHWRPDSGTPFEQNERLAVPLAVFCLEQRELGCQVPQQHQPGMRQGTLTAAGYSQALTSQEC